MSRQVALIVGVGQYDKKATGLDSLNAPVNDANALYDLLKKYAPDFQIVPLPEGRHQNSGYCVSKEKLSAKKFATTFKSIFTNKRNSAPDSVLFYFSGHGVQHEDLDGNHSYLAFSDKAMAYSLQSLCSSIESSAVKNVVVILDCCHSGEVHDFFVQLQHKRFCLIAASSAETEALAVDGHRLC